MAGRMPPSFMPPCGIVVRNCQLMATTPRATMTPTTTRMGTTTIRVMRPRSGEAQPLREEAVPHRRPPLRLFWKIADAAARLMRKVSTKRMMPMPKRAW